MRGCVVLWACYSPYTKHRKMLWDTLSDPRYTPEIEADTKDAVGWILCPAVDTIISREMCYYAAHHNIKLILAMSIDQEIRHVDYAFAQKIAEAADHPELAKWIKDNAPPPPAPDVYNNTSRGTFACVRTRESLVKSLSAGEWVVLGSQSVCKTQICSH